MKIKIAVLRGKAATNGFYPRGSVRMKVGDVFEFRPDEEEAYKAALATGFVVDAGDEEPVERATPAPRKRGRPRKTETPNAQG